MTWLTIYLLGVIQALFLAFLLLLTRNQRWPGNIYLSVLLLVIAGLLGIFALRSELGNKLYPWFFWTIFATPTLIGPCLLFYLRSLQSKFVIRRWQNTLHGLPFIMLILLFLPEILSPPSLGLDHLDEPHTLTKVMLAAYFKSLHILAYLIVCLRHLNPDIIHLSIKPEAATFLRWILRLFLLVALLGSVLSSLFWLGEVVLPAADYLELSFLTLITYLLAYYVFYFDVMPLNPKEKYANTALTDTVRAELAKRLHDLMVEDKLFIEPDYSATMLARNLSITEQQLSELIALELNGNFNSISNRFRFEHFTGLLQTKPELKLIDLAFDSGFKSKSSFNRVVKGFTDMSPSQYKKHVNNSDPTIF